VQSLRVYKAVTPTVTVCAVYVAVTFMASGVSQFCVLSHPRSNNKVSMLCPIHISRQTRRDSAVCVVSGGVN